MTKYLKEIAILTLAVWLIATYIWKPVEVVTETETVIEYREVKVEVKADPEIKWYPKEVKDTTGLAELNTLIDSLQTEMNALAESEGTTGTYVAEYDTTVVDSTGEEIAKISLQAISRIPLDPELKFVGSLVIKNKITTNTTTITYGKTFWQRFGISVQSGLGMGLITKQLDIYVGVGIHFEVN